LGGAGNDLLLGGTGNDVLLGDQASGEANVEELELAMEKIERGAPPATDQSPPLSTEEPSDASGRAPDDIQGTGEQPQESPGTMTVTGDYSLDSGDLYKPDQEAAPELTVGDDAGNEAASIGGLKTLGSAQTLYNNDLGANALPDAIVEGEDASGIGDHTIPDTYSVSLNYEKSGAEPDSLTDGEADEGVTSSNNLRQIGLAAHDHSDMHEVMPLDDEEPSTLVSSESDVTGELVPMGDPDLEALSDADIDPDLEGLDDA
jgi:hypothetical protein